MDRSDHTRSLGTLVASFHTLEALLRCYLLKMAADDRLEDSPFEGKVADVVPETPLTDFDSLRELIRKFNSNMTSQNQGSMIDEAIVELRNALAHGRVFGEGPSFPLRLLQYDKPQQGQVRIGFSELMTKQWFRDQLGRVTRETQKVVTALQQIGAAENA